MASTNSNKVFPSLTMPLWLLGTLLFLVLAKLGLQCWVVNKGLDIWDESWYIIILNFYKHYPTEPHSYYGNILNQLLPIHYNIITLRILGLCAEVGGAIFFTWSFYRWAQNQATATSFQIGSKAVLLMVLLVATFTSVYTRAFSYNDFSYLAILLATGTMFLVLQERVLPTFLAKAKVFLACLGIGLLLGMLLVVKFSASILTFLWIVLFINIHLLENWKIRIFFASAVLMGLVVFLSFFFGDISQVKLWLANMQQGIEMLRLLAYDTYGILVQGYLKVDILENGIYYALPLLIAWAGYYFLSKRGRTESGSLLWAYLLGVVSWLVLSLTIKHYFLGQFYYRFIALHIYTLLFWAIPFFKQQMTKKPWRELFYLTLLLVLPFIALFGSNNPTTQTLTKYLVPWYLVVFLLLSHRLWDTPKVMYAFLMFMALYAMGNFVSVQLLNPYGLRQPVYEQTEKVEGLKYLDGVRFDKPSAQFFSELKRATEKAGYIPSNPILALGDLCGAVVAMGGYMPETFWYFSDENATTPLHAREFSCMHLDNLRIAEHPRLPLVYINSGIHPTVVECLKASEVPFATDYYLVNTLYNPYAQESLAVWAPFNWELP